MMRFVLFCMLVFGREMMGAGRAGGMRGGFAALSAHSARDRSSGTGGGGSGRYRRSSGGSSFHPKTEKKEELLYTEPSYRVKDKKLKGMIIKLKDGTELEINKDFPYPVGFYFRENGETTILDINQKNIDYVTDKITVKLANGATIPLDGILSKFPDLGFENKMNVDVDNKPQLIHYGDSFLVTSKDQDDKDVKQVYRYILKFEDGEQKVIIEKSEKKENEVRDVDNFKLHHDENLKAINGIVKLSDFLPNNIYGLGRCEIYNYFYLDNTSEKKFTVPNLKVFIHSWIPVLYETTDITTGEKDETNADIKPTVLELSYKLNDETGQIEDTDKLTIFFGDKKPDTPKIEVDFKKLWTKAKEGEIGDVMIIDDPADKNKCYVFRLIKYSDFYVLVIRRVQKTNTQKSGVKLFGDYNKGLVDFSQDEVAVLLKESILYSLSNLPYSVQAVQSFE